MSNYTLFNLVLGFLVLVVCTCLTRKPAFHRLAGRISVMMVIIAFPWDFFAVTMGVWVYSDPGPLLFTVPVNDSAFIFICTYLAVIVLLHFRLRGVRKCHRRAQPKDTG